MPLHSLTDRNLCLSIILEHHFIIRAIIVWYYITLVEQK
jgi:hypothetical protein